MALGLSACSSAPKPQESAENTVKMAAILPLSGSRAADAHMLRRGMEIALEEINERALKSGQPKAELKYADTKSSSENIEELVELVQKSGASVIHAGFTDDIAFGVKKLGERPDTLVNFLCDYPPAAVQIKNALRIYPNGAQICELMAGAASQKAERYGDKKILILAPDTLAGASCSAYLKFETGSSNYKMFSETFKEGEQNFELLAEQLKSIKPDYILAYSSGDSALHILSALEKAGYRGVFATNETFAKFELKSTADISVFEVESAFSRGDTGSAFREKFKSKFNSEPNFAAAFAYDAVWTAYEAMAAAKGDAKLARESLLGKSLKGAAGEIKIDMLGDATSALTLTRK